MNQYTETLFLIGCYIVVADREINALEVEALDNLIQGECTPDILDNRNRIFSDADDKPDYYKLVNQLPLVCQNIEQKERAIRYLAQVACADGFIGSQKAALINDAAESLRINPEAIIQEEELLSAENYEVARMSGAKRLWGNVQKTFYDKFANKSKQNTLDRMFGGAAFQSVLEGITDQAMVDFERVDKIMSALDESLCQTSSEVASLSEKQTSKKKELQEIHKVLLDVNTHFHDLIEVSLKEDKEVLDKKQRNIRYFTIAFMGRTKAGKSTLHKVMTQEDSDDIGVGKLRTTRYNRSWYWDKLRIVDTPGIGAPGGDVDTNIAKSIIDEADLICYVVTNDSIQETEFDFFDTIKEHNKPLYIILNVKSNLSDSKRLEKFLDNPTKWKDSQGRDSIQGHIDRIHDKLDGKYNMNAVKIIPIHLLAAQLALCSDISKADAKVLLEGSNYLEFTNSIKMEVFDSGCLKKSLSVIEGSAYQIHQVEKCIQSDYRILDQNKESLAKRYNQYKRLLRNESERLLSDVGTFYDACRDALHNRAASFASEHYDDRNAGDLWNNDAVVKNVLNELNSRVNSRVDDYSRKIKDELEELFSDIKVNIFANANSSVSGESITDVKLGVGIVGALVSAATPIVMAALMSNPVGWVIGLVSFGVAILWSAITSLFTSREEKVRRATEKMKKTLDEEIDKSMNEAKCTGLSQLRTTTSEITRAIDAPFNTYIKGIEKLLNVLQKVLDQAIFDENVVNSLVGFRILDFVGKAPVKDKKVSELDNTELVNEYPTRRNWDNHTLSYMYPVDCTDKQLQKAETATQMNITITK